MRARAERAIDRTIIISKSGKTALDGAALVGRIAVECARAWGLVKARALVRRVRTDHPASLRFRGIGLWGRAGKVASLLVLLLRLLVLRLGLVARTFGLVDDGANDYSSSDTLQKFTLVTSKSIGGGGGGCGQRKGCDRGDGSGFDIQHWVSFQQHPVSRVDEDRNAPLELDRQKRTVDMR